jgi:Cu/Ag efflux pump CusA
MEQEARVSRLIDSVMNLGGLLVPICAILVGGAIAIVGMIHRHQERIAKIERGLDPDSGAPRA